MALRSRVLHAALGIALGAVFLYASLDKIAHPADFARIVYHYQLIGPSARLPPLLANTFALVLPWVEALTGVLLAAGLWRREAAIVAAAMLVAFLLGVGAALARGIDVENCGCFSVKTGSGRRAGAQLLLEDAALLAGALLLAGVKPVDKAGLAG
jgi:uncharacterized membrane protein YphA (DoxX/SURF4 family)